jgi:RNA polymerase sigma factor FliA
MAQRDNSEMPESTEDLIASKLPSVEKIIHQTASSFPAYVDRDELYGAGCLGLVEAAQRFDPSKGFSFSTWAEYRIRGAVLDYARSQDRLSQNNRRDARQLGLAVDELHRIAGRPPTNAEIAKHLQWSTYKVQEMKSFTEQSRPVVRPVEEYDAMGHGGGLSDRTNVSTEEEAENNELLNLLRVGLSALDDRQREIVVGLYVEGATTKEMSERCGISMSRVAQIRNETLDVLRDALTTHLEGAGIQPEEHPASKRHVRSRDAILAELQGARQNRPERPLPPSPRRPIIQKEASPAPQQL